MNVTLLAVDKLREPYLRSGCALYLKRLQPYLGISVREIKPNSARNAIHSEGQALLRAISDDDIVWALEQKGRMLSSTELAEHLEAVQRSGRRRLVIAIGGARGLAPEVVERAELTWSLSPLTFLHEMARLIVLALSRG